MSSSFNLKPTVLVVGSSGNAGFPVSSALLESGKFNIILLCRPGSENKPRILQLKQKGAQIRSGDIIEDSVEELESRALDGIEILIIMVSSLIIDTQKKILVAASRSKSIKRVIPSEFAIVHLKGDIPKRSSFFKKQVEIRTLVEQLNLPYTYINVGWWMDLILPYPSSDQSSLAERRLVALVLDDPRTLNQEVFGCGDEVSLNDVYDVAEKISKEGKTMRSKRVFITAEECFNRLEEAQKNYELAPSRVTLRIETMHVVHHIVFVDGENTVEVAKKLGYLDARALYPDSFKPSNLEELAKEFYGGGSDIFYPSRND